MQNTRTLLMEEEKVLALWVIAFCCSFIVDGLPAVFHVLLGLKVSLDIICTACTALSYVSECRKAKANRSHHRNSFISNN